MENKNINQINNSGRVWVGAIILFLGSAILLNNLGVDLPNWLFSFSNVLIALGLFIGVRRNFKGVVWLILVLVGAYNTLDNMDLGLDLSKYGFGVGLIIIGGFLLSKSKPSGKEKINFKEAFFGTQSSEEEKQNKADKNNDIIDVIAVFGGNTQTVYTKNFKGGDVTAVFGGADIILNQADFTDTVYLDVTAVFGGIKLIVPPHWAVKSNVGAVFGAVEEKRSQVLSGDALQKTLVLQGTVLFGGVEIKSF